MKENIAVVLVLIGFASIPLIFISLAKTQIYRNVNRSLSDKWANILMGSMIVGVTSFFIGSVLTNGYKT